MPTAITPPLTSDYLGTRVAMLDAIARYHSSDRTILNTAEQIALLKGLVVQASAESQLLASNGAIVGKAWERFLETSPPEAILAFLNRPEVIGAAQALAQVKTPVATLTADEALNFFGHDVGGGENLNYRMEKIIQESGLVNYQTGETLAAKFAQCLQEVGSPPIRTEHPSLLEKLRNVFASPFGVVKSTDMGLPALQVATTGAEAGKFAQPPFVQR